MKQLIVLGFVGAVAVAAPTANAQNHSHRLTRDSVSTMQRVPGELGRLNVEVKVADNVASTARISGDSALAIAVARVPEGAKVNAAKMIVENGHLVYDINVVPSGKNTVRKFYVDAMNGDVVKDKTLGGLNASVKKRQQHTKEVNARKAAEADTARKP
jgi:uncharacterized membrane protein YkoI